MNSNFANSIRAVLGKLVIEWGDSATGLIRYARPEIPKFVIDPAEIDPCVQLFFAVP